RAQLAHRAADRAPARRPRRSLIPPSNTAPRCDRGAHLPACPVARTDYPKTSAHTTRGITVRDIIYYLAAIVFALSVSVGVVQSDQPHPAQESAAAPAAPYT